ncbi:hypothetical protein QTP70_024440, partial [Hemibagrus guttatus]
VFTDIFNISLSRAVVSTCSKTTTVPEKSSVSYLNDYRSIALTPIVMKCSERLIMRHTKTWLPPALNPMQDAYRHNCSTDNTIVTHMHEGCSYVDFSSTEASVSLDQEKHVQHHNTKHWGPSRLCSQSTAVHSADSTNHIVVGLISKIDESAFKKEMQ